MIIIFQEEKLADISHLEFVKPGRVPPRRQDDDEIQIIAGNKCF